MERQNIDGARTNILTDESLVVWDEVYEPCEYVETYEEVLQLAYFGVKSLPERRRHFYARLTRKDFLDLQRPLNAGNIWALLNLRKTEAFPYPTPPTPETTP